MDLEPLRYWFDYEEWNFETLFYWGRIMAILALAWWLVRRHRLRKAAEQEQRVVAAIGEKAASETPRDETIQVGDLVSKLVDRVRGTSAAPQQEQPTFSAEGTPTPTPTSDQLLLDKLPSPTPGRCHLVFLNDDAHWVDIEVRDQDRALAMVGQKMLTLTLKPGTRVITVRPRKGDNSPTRVSVPAKDSYCLVELDEGRIKQCCSEHGPLDYDKLKVNE